MIGKIGIIERKTIHSLKTKVTDPTIRQDKNDALSISLKVDSASRILRSVLLFKEQGREAPTPRLSKEDCFLAIMTTQQLDIIIKCLLAGFYE